jgi:hypothetical protein
MVLYLRLYNFQFNMIRRFDLDFIKMKAFLVLITSRWMKGCERVAMGESGYGSRVSPPIQPIPKVGELVC